MASNDTISGTVRGEALSWSNGIIWSAAHRGVLKEALCVLPHAPTNHSPNRFASQGGVVRDGGLLLMMLFIAPSLSHVPSGSLIMLPLPISWHSDTLSHDMFSPSLAMCSQPLS